MLPSLPDEQLNALALSGEPLVFRAGTADVLGEFKVKDEGLIIELAQIDGGGEGVLPMLTSLAHRYAKQRGLKKVGCRVISTETAMEEINRTVIPIKSGHKVRALCWHGDKLIDWAGIIHYQLDRIQSPRHVTARQNSAIRATLALLGDR